MSLTAVATDEDDFKEITEANYKNIRSKMTKVGYADGVSDGRETAFQSGFDQGYADGLRIGFELQKYKIFFDESPRNAVDNIELQKERDIFNKLQLDETKLPKNCKLNNLKDQSIESISKEQQKYVDSFLEMCRCEFPLATALLSAQVDS